MKLAFCLFKYFRFGGLQLDFFRIAKECVARGHQVTVFTMRWDAPLEADLNIHIIPVKSVQNHTRANEFFKKIEPQLKQYDVVIGFNKMPCLDLYFASDPCYQAKARRKHGLWYRLTSRYRHFIAQEKAVFRSSSKTKILLLSPKQQEEFISFYKTPLSRMQLLPPGIMENHSTPEEILEIRKRIRKEFNILENEFLVLFVGSGFKTKGLDRALLAYSALPFDLKNKTYLFIIGQDRITQFKQRAKKLNIDTHVKFLGGRYDVPHFLFSADALIHPAYYENTGSILLEALSAGLPVLTTDVCGYAGYISKAKAGIVLSSPFQQSVCNQALADILLCTEKRVEWRTQAAHFIKQANFQGLVEQAVKAIESLEKNKLSK
jgi:UDP-glucose:(heptosyl)LPS alpha-1,3-glucosyltransferase